MVADPDPKHTRGAAHGSQVHAHGGHAHDHAAHDHASPGPHDHGHGRDHRRHEHGHAHGTSADRLTIAFAVGIGLNLAIVVGELVVGAVSRSVALVGDAGHNFGDVLGLALAGAAAVLARRRPSGKRTYGYRRATVLSSLANAVLLLVTTGALAWESVRRLLEPEPTQAGPVIVTALVGAVVNGLSAILFLGHGHDLNVRGAFAHLLGDAAIAVGVALSALVTWKTGWTWVDPATGLAVAALILAGTWSLLRSSVSLVLDAVPEGVDLEAVRAYLAGLPRVLEVHDLHIWAMSTTETALTAHLVMPGNSCEPHFLGEVCQTLSERFGIPHATLQVDPVEAPQVCRLAASETV